VGTLFHSVRSHSPDRPVSLSPAIPCPFIGKDRAGSALQRFGQSAERPDKTAAIEVGEAVKKARANKKVFKFTEK
jgi:hypothetical protein